MCRPKTNRAARLIASAFAVVCYGTWLASCSDADRYLDHRDTIALSAGDAIAGNKVGQIIDPWPPASGDKNIAFNGQKMQSAVERYRNNKVTPPTDPGNFEATNQSAPTVTTTVNTGAPPAATSTPGQ